LRGRAEFKIPYIASDICCSGGGGPRLRLAGAVGILGHLDLAGTEPELAVELKRYSIEGVVVTCGAFESIACHSERLIEAKPPSRLDSILNSEFLPSFFYAQDVSRRADCEVKMSVVKHKTVASHKSE
jgi:hypothetical protein